MRELTPYMMIPFADGGRDHSGCDCWGLVRLIYREQLGVELPSYGDISAKALLKVARAIKGNSDEGWVPTTTTTSALYDVVLMKSAGFKTVCHVGIVVAGDQVLHTEEGVGPMIVPFDHADIRERLFGLRRHKSLC